MDCTPWYKSQLNIALASLPRTSRTPPMHCSPAFKDLKTWFWITEWKLQVAIINKTYSKLIIPTPSMLAASWSSDSRVWLCINTNRMYWRAWGLDQPWYWFCQMLLVIAATKSRPDAGPIPRLLNPCDLSLTFRPRERVIDVASCTRQ